MQASIDATSRRSNVYTDEMLDISTFLYDSYLYIARLCMVVEVRSNVT